MKNNLENNKLIAEFMGWKLEHNKVLNQKCWFNNIGHCLEKNHDFKYDSSWDCLMPVVEKIEALPNNKPDVRIFTCNCIISDLGIGDFEDMEFYNNTKIEAVYDAVVHFIKWYNYKK